MSNPMRSCLAEGLCSTQKAGCLKVYVTPDWAVHCHCCAEGPLEMDSALSEIKPGCDVQGTGIKWLIN